MKTRVQLLTEAKALFARYESGDASGDDLRALGREVAAQDYEILQCGVAVVKATDYILTSFRIRRWLGTDRGHVPTKVLADAYDAEMRRRFDIEKGIKPAT